MQLALAPLILIVLLSACGGADNDDSDTPAATCSTTLPAGVTSETGMYGGVDREWQIAVPAGDVGGIVFDFHGTGGTIVAQDAITRLSVAGPERGYIVVTPQGLEIPARWTVPGIPGPDDVAFVSQLLADVRADVCPEVPAFATGKSSGAAMTTQLACETNLFTAVAPVAGISLYRRCPEGAPISVLTYHGTDDAWVPFEGPEGWPDVEAQAGTFFIGDPLATVEAFAERASCEGEPDVAALGDDTTVSSWDCPDGREMAFYAIDGGGHTHPGERALDAYVTAGVTERVGPTTTTFDGTEVMLDFFDRAALAG